MKENTSFALHYEQQFLQLFDTTNSPELKLSHRLHLIKCYYQPEPLCFCTPPCREPSCTCAAVEFAQMGEHSHFSLSNSWKYMHRTFNSHFTNTLKNESKMLKRCEKCRRTFPQCSWFPLFRTDKIPWLPFSQCFTMFCCFLTENLIRFMKIINNICFKFQDFSSILCDFPRLFQSVQNSLTILPSFPV